MSGRASPWARPFSQWRGCGNSFRQQLHFEMEGLGASSHLAEQIAVKAFIPVVAISADHTLTSTNIPWIFRLPDNTGLPRALGCLSAAMEQAGPNRAGIRAILASGQLLAGIRFNSTGDAGQ
jgi:hypothetical protein